MAIAEEQVGIAKTCPRSGMAIVVTSPWNPRSDMESELGREALGETPRCQRWIRRIKVTEKAMG